MGRPLAPAHQDPVKQQKRERERLKKQRAAQRAAEAAENGVCPAPLKHGPKPLPDEAVSAGHRQKRARKAVKAAVAVVTGAGLPDLAAAAGAIESVAAMAAENAAATQAAAAQQAAAEQAVAEAAVEAIKAAATEAAAAELEAAINQVAACVAAVEVAMGEVCEEMVSELTAAEAERQRVAQAWARKIAPDRGYVDEARSRSNAREQHTCFICLDTLDSNLPTDSYMPCCRNHVHKACIQTWHAMGQDKTGKHVLKAPRIGGGWKPVAMERLHNCPFCNYHLSSARVPRV